MNKLCFAIAVTVIAAGAGAVRAGDKDIVEALYTKVLSDATSPELAARVNEVLSPSWRSIGDYSNPAKTRDQFLIQLQRTGVAAPDMVFRIEDILQLGNRFVVRGRATATPLSTFLGVAATGQKFEIMTIDIHTVEKNMIVTSYHVEDWRGAIEQIQKK
jgi:predicted ester cyclase